MKEIATIVRLWNEMETSGTHGVLVTIVSVKGSHYRRLGARMLIAENDRVAGSISGGCMEADLKEHAGRVLRADTPELIRYDTSREDDLVYGTGMGCGGVVDLLLEPTTAESVVLFMSVLQDCLKTRQRSKVATVHRAPQESGIVPGDRVFVSPGGAIRSTLNDTALTDLIASDLHKFVPTAKPLSKTYPIPEGEVMTLLEVIRPPVSLLLLGAGDDAKPITAMAKTLGWHVTVSDHRSDFADPNRFPSADSVLVIDNARITEKLDLSQYDAVVIMTHNYFQDRLLLEQVLSSGVDYVGLLGAVKRSARILAEVKQAGVSVSAEQLARFYTPVGLDLGADGPEEIALSILAEIQAVLSQGSGRSLREPVSGKVHG